MAGVKKAQDRARRRSVDKIPDVGHIDTRVSDSMTICIVRQEICTGLAESPMPRPIEEQDVLWGRLLKKASQCMC